MKLRYVNIAVLIIILINNLIGFILKNTEITKIIIYCLPFIVLIIFLFINKIKEYKLNAFGFFLLSICSTFFGNYGNLTGAIFFFLAVYILHNYERLIISIFVCLLIIITLKFYFSSNDIIIIPSEVATTDYNIFRYINYLVGFFYIIFCGYYYFYPKKVNFGKVDFETLKIIEYKITGLSNNRISQKMSISNNAINKRLSRIRKSWNCNNNEELIFKLAKNGIIRLNTA